MSKSWALVSPASRGIGRQIARNLLRNTKLPVVATARTDLQKIKEKILDETRADPDRLTVLKLDVTDEASIEAAAAECKSLFPSAHLRMAFVVPGILNPERSPAQIDAEKALDTFRVNTLGPMLMLKHFLGFLPKKANKPEPPGDDVLPDPAVFALMSARVGSTSDNHLGGWYSYRASKAGVTSLAKSVDVFTKARSGDNATCIALHPGTVKTEFTKEFWGSTPKNKLLDTGAAVEMLMEVVRTKGLEGRGRFWDYKGKEVLP